MKEINFKNQNDRKDFLSVDSLTAISAEGEIFNVGDVVVHDDKDAGIATIQSFELNKITSDVIANTDKGHARICFISKTK